MRALLAVRSSLIYAMLLLALRARLLRFCLTYSYVLGTDNCRSRWACSLVLLSAMAAPWIVQMTLLLGALHTFVKSGACPHWMSVHTSTL